jgi:hypothetical protein
MPRPEDIKCWLDASGNVATNLPGDCVLVRDFEDRDGERVLVGQRVERISVDVD